MNTFQEDNEQMEYLRQHRLKKEQRIRRRKERYRVLVEKTKAFFGFNTSSQGKTR